MLPPIFDETCDLLDAIVFTGDALYTPAVLAQFEEYLSRWNRAVDKIKEEIAIEEARKNALHIDIFDRPLIIGDLVIFKNKNVPTQGTILKLEDTHATISYRNAKGFLVAAVQNYSGIVKVIETI